MKKALEIHTKRKKKNFLSGATGNQPEATVMEISDTNFHRFYWKVSSHVLLSVSQTMNTNILPSSFNKIIMQLNSYSQMNMSHLSICI